MKPSTIHTPCKGKCLLHAAPARTSCKATRAHCRTHPPDADSKGQTTAAAPLVEAVLRRGQQHHEVPLHVPGHKRGRGLDKTFREAMGGALQYDTTELSGLDFLGSPSGVIQEAQAAAAEAFGARRTWFLVNGCSVGIHAAVMAVAKPGDTLLLARNCHQSAFAAMALTGCIPFWLYPESDPEFHIAHGITPAVLRAGLRRAKALGQRVAGVLVVSPTYYGAASHLTELAHICHEEGTVLLVDEAHGAHFGLHPDLPPSALQQGADVAIQSTHKVLSAMTQAAMLHVGSARVCPERASRALRTLQSSSPSYLLLASLDAARTHAQDANACFGEPLQAALAARSGLASNPGLRLLDVLSDNNRSSRRSSSSSSAAPDFCSVSAWDPLRITVGVSGLGLSGFEAAELLEQHYHIVAELATQKAVLFMFGPGSRLEDAQALVRAFEALMCGAAADDAPNSDRRTSEAVAGGAVVNEVPRPDGGSAQVAASDNPTSSSWMTEGEQQEQEQHSSSSRSSSSSSSSSSRATEERGINSAGSSACLSDDAAQPSLPAQPDMRLSPREALFASTRRVHHCQAVGCISAELLCPYPPGIPLLFPGEVITEAAVAALLTAATCGTVTGGFDPTVETISVIDDRRQ